MKNKPLISIFVKQSTPRFHYAKYLIFELLLGLEADVYTDYKSFVALNTPKINYSNLKIANSFHINPAPLLFDDTIEEIHLESNLNNSITPVLFPTSEGDINFDPLAAAFYIVSRYEEYLPHKRDQHNRYPANQSILNQLDCLEVPIVQEWVEQLKKKLKAKFSTLSFHKPTFQYIPSFDIDMAWSFKAKGAYRTIGGYAKDIISINIASTKQRLKVNLGLQNDPFDQFEYFRLQTEKNGLEPIYFFLMGEYSDYDKNVHPNHPKFKQLIKNIASKYTTGIHPSYYYEKNISQEIKTLHKITNKTIELSRQHFIKLSFPDTYQLLIKNKIKADFSMGYPEKIGFRNGLSVPSLWYDLSTEQTTDLMVHPFQIMDVTLKNYLNLEPDQAIEKIKNIVNTIARYGGTMISIWHNSSFDKDWIGWHKVFEEMLSYSSETIST